MTFLRKTDVLELIELVSLNQITDSDDTRIDKMELEAISEMRSYLMQRYDVDKAFEAFTTFDVFAEYVLGNRIIWTISNLFSPNSAWVTSNVSGAFNNNELITADNGATGQLIGLIGANTFTALTGDWASAVSITGDVSAETADIASIVTYAIDDFVLGSDDNIYLCLVPTLLSPINNDTEWELVTENNSIYYCNFPFPAYDGTKVYYLNDKVTFFNKVYSANRTIYTGIQPLSADGSVNTYWTLVGNADSTIGDYPNDATHWTKGDNRSGQLVQKTIDVLLYHLHARINPRNIPELRMVRYDGNHELQLGGAVGWLKNVASGKINAEIPQRYEFATVPGVAISSGNTEFLRSQKSYC